MIHLFLLLFLSSSFPVALKEDSHEQIVKGGAMSAVIWLAHTQIEGKIDADPTKTGGTFTAVDVQGRGPEPPPARSDEQREDLMAGLKMLRISDVVKVEWTMKAWRKFTVSTTMIEPPHPSLPMLTPELFMIPGDDADDAPDPAHPGGSPGAPVEDTPASRAKAVAAKEMAVVTKSAADRATSYFREPIIADEEQTDRVGAWGAGTVQPGEQDMELAAEDAEKDLMMEAKMMVREKREERATL